MENTVWAVWAVNDGTAKTRQELQGTSRGCCRRVPKIFDNEVFHKKNVVM